MQDPASRELGRVLAAQFGDPGREPDGFLAAVFDLQPRAWLRRMPRRETFAHGERIVFKRYRGDDWAERWHAWMHGEETRSPGRREAENLAALREAGLCVPAPVAWCEEPRAKVAPWWGAKLNARSALAMEFLPHEEHLRRRLEGSDAAMVRAWIAPLAKLVAQLHREHWFHRDLYLQHFAVLDAKELRLALLDCGRARHRVPVPARWIVKDLAQLLHSCPGSVGERVRLRWLAVYARERGSASMLDHRGLDLRRLARAVLAKELRMRSHRPRHVDPRTATPDGSER
jgi:tRNA A-37 threonylcarbamoyl transferase component Bud32